MTFRALLILQHILYLIDHVRINRTHIPPATSWFFPTLHHYFQLLLRFFLLSSTRLPRILNPLLVLLLNTLIRIVSFLHCWLLLDFVFSEEISIFCKSIKIGYSQWFIGGNINGNLFTISNQTHHFTIVSHSFHLFSLLIMSMSLRFILLQY